MKRTRVLGWSTTRWATVVVAVAAMVVGGTTAALAASAPSSPATTAPGGSASPAARSMGAAVPTAGFPSGGRTPGIFTDRCGYSHEGANDPILHPGAAGQSMQHDFFGNTTTSASSTAQTLVGQPTTCTTSADASAYWTPVLYQDGRPLTPRSALIYWRQRTSLDASVRPLPAGLEMIAGDESAPSPQSLSVTRWTCSGSARNQAAATASPHDCQSGQLRLTVTFPSCWDGHTLNAANQTNVVYPTATGCPTSHPVVIPQIVFHLVYPTSTAADITVSMSPTMQGSVNTEHVDFINGWNQTRLDADVNACIATATRCGPVIGAQATPQGPNPAAATRRHRQPGSHRARDQHPQLGA
jgi:Domain of unknown function (DUF1996)